MPVKGGGGGVDLDELERLSGIQADIAQQLFTQTDPLRQNLVGQLGGFLGAPPQAPAAPPTAGPGVPVNVQQLFNEQQFLVPQDGGNEIALGLGGIVGAQPVNVQQFVPEDSQAFFQGLFAPNRPQAQRTSVGIDPSAPGATTQPVTVPNQFRQPGGAAQPAAAGESVLPVPFQGLFGEEPGALPGFAQEFFGEEPGALPEFAQDFFGEEGQIPPFLLPAFAPLREATEAQFGRARENIIGRTGARGGQLSQNLANLEVQRAQAVGALEAPLRQQLFNQELGLRQGAFNQQLGLQQGLFGQQLGLTSDLFNQTLGTAFGAPQTALSGLSSAQAGLAQAGQIGAAQQAAAGQSLGQLAGLGLKAGLLFGGGPAGAAGAAGLSVANPKSGLV